LLATGVDAKTCKLIVIDQNINSMTQFKQIIGRGTRIREDYQKLYFTIMDFKGATRLFADPLFDGEPVVIYEPKPDEPVIPPGDKPEFGPNIISDPPPPYGGEPGETSGPRAKYVIDDVNVRTAVERSQYLDEDGKLITEDYRVLLKGEIKKTLRAKYGTMDQFLIHWSAAERKQAILDELKEQGIPLEVLQQAVPQADELDAFDLVAHVAFDQKPITRKERAENVRKRNYFAKYGEQARAVLEYPSGGVAIGKGGAGVVKWAA
jgi:type I restriction enzyme R subunit